MDNFLRVSKQVDRKKCIDILEGYLENSCAGKVFLTFAFGARESARNVIAGHYVRQNFRQGQRLTLGEYSGTVRSTSGAYTVLETAGEGGDHGTLSLPNSLLLQSAVAGQESTANTNITQPEVPRQENPPNGSSNQPEVSDS